MNVIIDTNIFYSWVKVFENNKLTSNKIEELSKSHELYITTTSILECIIKFQNDLGTLKKCLSFIISNKVKIISIGFTPVSNEQILTIYNSDTLKDCKDVFEQLFALKIEKETEFLRFYFIALICGSIEFFFKDVELSPIKYESLVLHSKVLVESNSQFVFDGFKEKLLQGYRDNKIDSIIKKYFSEMLYLFIRLWRFNYYLVTNGSSIHEVTKLDKKLKEEIITKTRDDEIVIKLKKSVENNISSLSIFKSMKFKEPIEKFIKGLDEHLSGDQRFTEIAINYIAVKLKRYFCNGKKMEKNDILDLLIMYALNLDGFMLITLDKDMKNILRTLHPESYNLIIKYIH